MSFSVEQMTEARRALEGPLYADVGGDVEVSFDYPAKTDKAEETLWQSIETLAPLGPRFLSVTYGAGGSTRDRTHATVARIAREAAAVPAAAHLTCVEATREEIDAVAEESRAAGVRHIVALRGDPPAGASDYAPHPGGYENAAALVAGLRRLHPFEISVAGYPECHPNSADQVADLDNLKRKLDAGANHAIAQFFFEPDVFFRYNAAAAAGIDAEIMPGIMPIASFAGVRKMAAMCETDVPAWLGRLFEGLDDRPAARQLVSATVRRRGALPPKLYAGGVKQFHFYTMNRAGLSCAICHLLGVRAGQGETAGEAKAAA
ncbi:methylenetetrahydrofolate reductase [Sphingomonas sp. MMS24-JH45]